MPILTPAMTTFGLLTVTALGYALATVGMKHATQHMGWLAISMIALGLLGAVLAEVALLRSGNLSLVYIGIIVAESALVLSYAMWIGHGLSLQQGLGAGLVFCGVLVLSLQH